MSDSSMREQRDTRLRLTHLGRFFVVFPFGPAASVSFAERNSVRQPSKTCRRC